MFGEGFLWWKQVATFESFLSWKQDDQGHACLQAPVATGCVYGL